MDTYEGDSEWFETAKVLLEEHKAGGNDVVPETNVDGLKEGEAF